MSTDRLSILFSLGAFFASVSEGAEATDRPAYCFLLLDIGGVPSRWITADPEGCPRFRSLSRKGVTFLKVESKETDPLASLSSFLTGAEFDLPSEAVRRYGKEKTWFPPEFQSPLQTWSGVPEGEREGAAKPIVSDLRRELSGNAERRGEFVAAGADFENRVSAFGAQKFHAFGF